MRAECDFGDERMAQSMTPLVARALMAHPAVMVVSHDAPRPGKIGEPSDAERPAGLPRPSANVTPLPGDEHEARVHMLDKTIVNWSQNAVGTEHDIVHDELRLELDSGQTIVIRAQKLWLRLEPTESA